MIRLTNHLSSKALFAAFYSSTIGLSISITVWMFDWPDPFYWVDTGFYPSWLVAMIIQPTLWAIVLYPMVFFYSVLRLPKRIILRESGLTVTFLFSEREYSYQAIKDMGIKEKGRHNFLYLDFGGRRLNFEVDDGQLRRINEFVPVTIETPATARERKLPPNLMRTTKVPGMKLNANSFEIGGVHCFHTKCNHCRKSAAFSAYSYQDASKNEHYYIGCIICGQCEPISKSLYNQCFDLSFDYDNLEEGFISGEDFETRIPSEVKELRTRLSIP